ncbi:outer membrane beta-barrel protein [uncultured Vibrio sp.]|uniref:outer membrane beta-barrel protein n=1 Tax=uncultured Vibrio sp. TaxID=114054 RepID=UPI0025E1FB24|nr:outer membrane beta-barrel protein [uncultured Vibrio sp.]
MSTFRQKILASSLAIISLAAHGIESDGYITENGLNILPLLDTKIEHVDNIGRYSKEETAESSTVFIIEPGLVLSSDRNGNQYQVLYQLSSVSYFDSSDDNYTDHTFATNNFVQINNRNGFGLNYAYLYMHEERGTGILAGDALSTIAKEPVEYSIHNVSATHTYGSEQAKGKLETSLVFESKAYQNYRDISSADFAQVSTKFKDYNEFGGAVAFYFQALPATDLLFEVNLADRNYSLNDPATSQSQDNFDSFYYVGATWDVTGKTDGKLRLGLQNKSYEDTTKENFSGFSWDLDLKWQPAQYSSVTVSAAQRAKDPDQGSNFVNETSFEGSWKHFWLTHLYSNLDLQLIMDDYSESNRSDDLVKTSISLGYELRDFADIYVGWRNENNDSSIVSNTYDQNVWYIAANLAL